MEKLQRACREQREAKEAWESLQATETALQLQNATLQEHISTNKDKLIKAKDTLEQKTIAHQATAKLYQYEKFAAAEP